MRSRAGSVSLHFLVVGISDPRGNPARSRPAQGKVRSYDLDHLVASHWLEGVCRTCDVP